MKLWVQATIKSLVGVPLVKHRMAVTTSRVPGLSRTRQLRISSLLPAYLAKHETGPSTPFGRQATCHVVASEALFRKHSITVWSTLALATRAHSRSADAPVPELLRQRTRLNVGSALGRD